jgi:hypothetical protein
MTKVLLLVSAVIMALAIFFSYQNRQIYLDARLARFETDGKINAERKSAEAAAAQVNEIKSSIVAMNTEVSNEQERVNQANIKLKNLQSEGERDATDLASVQSDINKIKSDVTKLPDGVTIETITEKMNQYKQTIADNEAKAAKIQEDGAAKEKEVKKAQEELADVQKRIEERKKLFDRNKLTATIVAVNNDWGFVVIDGGVNKSITSDTKLLVTRGNDVIGKLDIIAVEPSKTVANIVQKSMRPGMNVAPGDKVILETLYQ